MLTRTVMRVGLVFLMLVTLVTNGVVNFAAPANAAVLPASTVATTKSMANSTISTAAVKPHANACILPANSSTTPHNTTGAWGQAYKGTSTDQGSSTQVTVTMLTNSGGNYTQVAQTENKFSGAGSYFVFDTNSVTNGFNGIGPGFSFILYFQAPGQTSLYYPNRLDTGSAMVLHFDNNCDVVDDQGNALTGPGIFGAGFVQMNLLDKGLVGGRLISSGSYPGTNANSLTDAQIESSSAVSVTSSSNSANVKLCNWNPQSDAHLPDPANCSGPVQEQGSPVVDADGYYLLGGIDATGQTLALLFTATGYRDQAYYASDFAYPLQNGENSATVITASTTSRIPVPSGLSTSQTEFNAVMNGNGAITGQVTDGGSGRSGCNEALPNATVYAYDTSLPYSNGAIAIAGTDSSGNYALGGLSPGRSYTVTVQPPGYYGSNAVTFNGSNCSTSYEYVNNLVAGTQTIPANTGSNGITVTQSTIQMPLGSGIQGVITAGGGGQFTSGGYVEIAVWPHGQESGNAPLYTVEVAITQTETSFSYSFPRLLQPGANYDLEFAPLGTGNYQVAWYDGTTNGSQSPANANLTAVATSGYFNANITLQVGKPLQGIIYSPANLNLATKQVAVLVQVYEASTGQFVTGFQVDQFTGHPDSNGDYSWVSPALSPTDSYIIQFIPSPGNSTGLNSVYYAYSASAPYLGTPTYSAATQITPNSNTVVKVTLQTGGEFVVHVTANGIAFGNVNVSVVNATSATTCGTTVFAKAVTRSADGVADFKDLPLGTYCIISNPPGNLASDIEVNQSLTSGNPKADVFVNLTVGSVYIKGTLSSSDGASSHGPNDFAGWSVELLGSTNQGVGLIALCSASSCGSTDTSGNLNYSILVPQSASNQGGRVEVYFVPPSSGSNYVPEYYGPLVSSPGVSQHSPVTDPGFSNANATVDVSSPQSGTKTITGINGVFAQGGILTLHTQDLGTSAFIPNVPVGLYTGTPPNQSAVVSATTNSANGDWTSDLLPVGSTYYAYAAGASLVITPGYLSQWYNGQYSPGSATPIKIKAGDQQKIVFGLPRQSGIIGQVTGSLDGINNVKPLAGVTVNFYQNGGIVGTVTTGADGGYAIQLPPGSYQIQFSAVISGLTASGYYCSDPNATGYVTQDNSAACAQVSTTQGQSTNNNAVILSGYTNNGAIVGQVTGSLDGVNGVTGVAGVTVSSPGVSYQATTDANGNYILFVPPGSHTVHFTTSQFSGVDVYYSNSSNTGTIDVNSASAVSVPTIGYPAGVVPNINILISGYTNNGTIGGNVVGSSDGNNPQPVPGATVQVYSTANSASPVATVQTDSNGNYTAFVAPGSYRVYFSTSLFGGRSIWYNSKGDFASADNVQVSQGQDTKNINANLSLVSVSGTVYGQNNGQPAVGLAQTTITAYASSDKSQSNPIASVTSNSDGTYSLPLPSGNYILYFTNSSFGLAAWYNSSASGNLVTDVNSATPIALVGANVTNINVTANCSGPNCTSGPTSYTYFLPYVANNAAGVGGSYTTFIAMQNVGSAPASVQIVYYGQSSTQPLGTENNNGNTLAVNSEYTPKGLASGQSGSAMIISSQPLAAIVSQYGSFDGGVNSGYTAVNGNLDAKSTIYAPITLYKAYGDFNSSLVLEDVGNADTTATITYYNSDGSVASTRTVNLAYRVAQTIAQDSSQGLQPNYTGWAKITSSNGQPLAGTIVETSINTKFLSTVACSGNPGTNIYLPVVFQVAFGNFTTSYQLANPNNAAAHVTVTYHNKAGAVVHTSHDSFTIPANGNIAFFHSSDAFPEFKGVAGGFVGSAAITSDQPLISLVNQSNGALSGSFGTITAGGTHIGLPTIMKNGYGSFNSGMQLVNTSNVATTVTLTFYDGTTGNQIYSTKLLNDDGSVATLQPGAAGLAAQFNDSRLPNPFVGTVIATPDVSGASLVVVTNVSGGPYFYTYAEPAYLTGSNGQIVEPSNKKATSTTKK